MRRFSRWLVLLAAVAVLVCCAACDDPAGTHGCVVDTLPTYDSSTGELRGHTIVETCPGFIMIERAAP
jgi:hypothetical protein